MARIQRRKVEGAITVFFSLILCIILSFVLMIVEGARINSAQLLTQRSLMVSMDSALAEYYRPLWDEYHIFGLDVGYGTSREALNELSDRMKGYINDQIASSRSEIEGKIIGGTDLYQLSLHNLEIEKPVMLTDYKGELFLFQAAEYMKYKEMGNGVEKILEKTSLLETPKKVSVVYEEKVKVEEELSKIDEGILQLMELLDGIKTSKKGIETTSNGGLVIKQNFIKKICMTHITQENVSLNHPTVFQALKSSYHNPYTEISTMEQYVNQINGIISSNSSMSLTCQRNNELILQKNKQLQELSNLIEQRKGIKEQKKELEKEKSEKEKSEKERLEKEINDLRDENRRLSDDIARNQRLIKEFKGNILELKEQLVKMFKEIVPFMEEAMDVIDHILIQRNKSAVEINKVEKLLNSQKDDLMEDIYTALQEEMNVLKRYTTEKETGYRFQEMKIIINENETSLRSTISLLEKISQLLESNDLTSVTNNLSQQRIYLQSYQIKTLTIDYSSLVLEKGEKSSFKSLKKLIENGFWGLVIEEDEISKKLLTTELLPSQGYESQKEGSQEGLSITDYFMELIKNQSANQMAELFNTVNQQESMRINLMNMVNELAKVILYHEYVKEHFYTYTYKNEGSESRKPTVLNYEQEYLIYGNATDQDNLQAMMSHILLSRIMFNFISLLKDTASCNEAKLMAAAMVGFTGLPILVSITQMMILLVWSLGESLIDTAALLQGLDIPIIKNKLVLSLSELLLLNHSFIEQKVSTLTKDSTKQGITLNYSDYLYLFLLFKNSNTTAFREMDLIQENLKIRYDDNFRINLCLYGFESKAFYQMPTKFSALLAASNGSKKYKIAQQGIYSY